MPKKERRRFTPEQRAEILREFHSSGLTKGAFARQKGLHSSMLGNWLREEQELSEPSPTVIRRRGDAYEATSLSTRHRANASARAARTRWREWAMSSPKSSTSSPGSFGSSATSKASNAAAIA